MIASHQMRGLHEKESSNEFVAVFRVRFFHRDGVHVAGE